MGRVCELPTSGLFTDVLWGLSPSFGWATQGQSETCSKATPALSCFQSNCCAERWTVAPVWGCMLSGADFLQGPLCIWLHSSSILTSLPVPAAEKHPHSMMQPPPCFTVGIWSAWCSPDIVIGVLPKELNFLHIRTESSLNAIWPFTQ